MTGQRKLCLVMVETVAGLSAGSMATLIVHPLDIVKTRMQSRPARAHRSQ